ncbi:MAG: hypothetical protein KDB80_05820, partial [Planctomycetes bacterium]|nr:hypothetical protein [Planctomycetota bacterium]
AILLFDVAAGNGSFAFSGAPLWVGLTPQLLAFDLGLLRGRRWGDGYASWSIDVPNFPALAGLSIFLQGLIADYGAPHGIAATAGQRIEFFAPR